MKVFALICSYFFYVLKKYINLVDVIVDYENRKNIKVKVNDFRKELLIWDPVWNWAIKAICTHEQRQH